MEKGRDYLNNSSNAIETAYKTGIALRNEAQYDSLKTSLTTCVEKAIGKVKIHFYGSRMIGLGNKGSDLDIYVEQGDNYHANKNVDRDQALLRKIADALKTSGLWSIKNDDIILSATVPVINCVFQGNLNCDITVSNGLAVENSKIMRYLFEMQPEAMKLFHFMKEFLSRNEYDINGYLFKLLVIFYLQKEKLLPSIVDAQKDLAQRQIDGYQYQFDPSRGLIYYKLEAMKAYKDHVPKFLQFYGQFDYGKYVMSIREGKAIERAAYQPNGEIKDKPLCVFGPLNRKHNIGKRIQNANEFAKMMNKLFKSM